jgi:hypothetical protein
MKGLDMADILKQLMQLNMQNRAGRSPSGRGQIGGTDFASIAKLLAGRGVTPDGIRPPPQVTDPNTTINASPDPIAPSYPPNYFDPPSVDTDPNIGYPVPPVPTSPLDEVEQARQIQRSYNLDANGNQTEIGYDGQPLSSYTPEQMSIHNAIKGVTPSQSRYVFNGEGYDLVPYEPQHPEESTRRPIDFYNPSPPMDFPEDPGFAPMPTPIGTAKSLASGDMRQILEEAMRAYRDQQNFDPQPNPYDQYRD